MIGHNAHIVTLMAPIVPARYVVLDIETGDPEEDAIQAAIDGWKAPSNWKPETVEKNRVEYAEKIRSKAALLDSSPILCVGCKGDTAAVMFSGMGDPGPLNMQGWAESHRAGERDMLVSMAAWLNAHTDPVTILVGHNVRGYIAERQAAGLTAGGINKEIGILSSALNWARKDLEWDVPNPWEGRRLREPTGRTRYLSHDEAAALLDAAHARRARWPWIEDFIRVCTYSGLRPGEALGLEWARIDLTARLISFMAGDQKNRKRRAIPINDSARAALIARASFRAEHCPGSPWVFCRRDGSRVACVKKGFAACAADAGIEDLHPHDLRRTFGSWLVQAGVGIERVSELLRHGDVRITAQVYAHLRPQDLADAAGVLDLAPVRGFTPEFHTTSNTKTSRS